MITDFKDLRPGARLFIALVVLAGASAIGHSVHQLVVYPISNRWLILAVLTLLTGSFNVKVSSINAYISVSEAFVFASILLFGTAAGTATVLIECMVILLWMKPEGRLLHRVLFNMAAPSVAVWTAGTAFYLLSGIEPYSQTFTPLPTLFVPLLAFTALYFLLNSWLVAIAVGLEDNRSPLHIWWKNFAWLSVNYFSGASLAALIVTYSTKQLDISSLAVIVPLLVVSYLTFRTAMGRAEDSYSHLSELNRLYLSTIETLAMAIDAKDQITHGHIRRVQAYAVGLAKAVGVSDEKLLQAIQAAALLHDMGKLAVPEHILNKPGKLTAAEFEKMKLHASFGADMLSAIDFPYPVVPIVRHHHENWDGTGYPTGIRGTDIPIGARILSVVDCFDALTSDRPYRPRLSDDDAIGVLLGRRGSMYDPLVVDTFLKVHKQIAPPQQPASAHRATDAVPRPRDAPRSGSQATAPVAASAPGPARLAHSRTVTIPDLDGALATRMGVSVPFSLAILYLYDRERDELVARQVAGQLKFLVSDIRISLGAQLSGWVAANRRTIVNSDPALDLGALATALNPRLIASLCVPLAANDELLGVLALYSTAGAYTDEHRRLAEAAGDGIARHLWRGTATEVPSDRDPLTGLPMSSTMVSVLNDLEPAADRARQVSLVLVDVVRLGDINRTFGREAGDRALVQIASQLQACLPDGGVLFRCPGDEFAALLSRGEPGAVALFAKKVRQAVRNTVLHVEGASLDLQVSTNSVAVPSDAAGLYDLLSVQHHSAGGHPTKPSDSRVH